MSCIDKIIYTINLNCPFGNIVWINQLSEQAKKLITNKHQISGEYKPQSNGNTGSWLDSLSEGAKSLISNIKKTEILKPEGRELFKKGGSSMQFPVSKPDIQKIASPQFTPIGEEPTYQGNIFGLDYSRLSPEMQKEVNKTISEKAQMMAGGMMGGLKEVGSKAIGKKAITGLTKKIEQPVFQGLKDLSTEIDELVNNQNIKDNIKLDLFKIEDKTVEKIKNILGDNLSNYTHQIDNYAIRHTLKQHSKPKYSFEMPLKKEDFKLIPDIIKNYDDIIFGGITESTGLPSIRYSKRYNGYTYYVEEIRRNNRTLSFKTMFKNKTP